jgi:malonate-semialdehyde dehydrogenase (acetylating) / methylmalonate-semialdehyde dehydrogenase
MFVERPKTVRECRNFVNGAFIDSSITHDVVSPWTGELIGRVVTSNNTEVDQAVKAAENAFGGWRATPIKERSAKLFKFRELVLAKLDFLANVAALEAGKTVAEARAGVLKGLEVSEFALSIQNMDSGAVMDVSRGVSCEYRREPLGVVVGIAPFNFPAMVPMWMYPIAITLGNCFILKPSEKVPLTSQFMAELMTEAGFPKGVFQLINGGKETVEALVDHPLVKAVGFVGSTPIAKSLYVRATSQGKRALCLGGAKNHLLVVPDADEKITVRGVVDSFTGCAGQRCMAASLMLAVGEVDHLIAKITETTKSIKLGAQMGAIIDKIALSRIRTAISEAEKQGAKILVDGRTAEIPKGFEGGHWIGPTIIDHATPEMECAKSEIFGPVMTIVRVKNLTEAMAIEAKSPFGNATSVFTTSGGVARFVAETATNGMIGVNIGVPVPREPFSFGGSKESKFGVCDITGESSLEFWTQRKKITVKWAEQSDATWMS